ncbi:MAG TPA: glycosyltransferase [Polyangia bacterium]|jgi:glycosyltransferase involved in cell wall biosynthesis|nr:glycosyltransferase [Polyangia bacterium]
MPEPIDATKPHRLFAWPRYDQAGDLQTLAQIFGPALANRTDVRLYLRHDETVDPPIAEATRALEAAFVGALGADADVDVLLVNEPLDDAGWAALAPTITTVLLVPSSLEPARRRRLTELRRPMVATGDDLRLQMSAATGAPKVTAIVSTYKSAVFMRGCLDDLVGQTLYAKGLLEIIVIDSGSPENEGDIVREMQLRYPAIHHVRTERETLYAAWNRAVALARGAYLTSANTDDRHRPDALEILAATLDAHPDVAVVYADQAVTKRPNETFARNSASTRFDWPAFSFAALQQRCIIGPQPMWRRSLHDRWGLFDAGFAVAGDYEFWLRIGRDEKFLRVPEVLGLYYQNGTGLEYASGERTAVETIEIQRRYGDVRQTTAPASAPAPTANRTSSKQPLVSVIMPTYNRPAFLTRALDSLTRQTLNDFEVVVVNDAGAPIETLLDGYADRLAITYVRQACNRDRSAARNAGIRVARGQLIAYLDDDDCYLPDHLQTLVDALGDGRHQVAFSEAVLISEQKTNGHYTPGDQIMRMSLPFNRERLLVYNDIPILCVMHQRSCLDEVGLFDETLGTHEDWDLLIRLAHHFAFAQVRKLTAAISWREDGSSTTSGRRDDFRHTLAVIHERYKDLAARHPEVLARQQNAREGVIVPTAPAPAPALPVGATPAQRAYDLLARAQAAFVQGEVGRARQILTGGVDLAPQVPEVVVALADVFATEGNVNAACELLARIARMHPQNRAADERRAEILAEAGERARARQAAQRAFGAAVH